MMIDEPERDEDYQQDVFPDNALQQIALEGEPGDESDRQDDDRADDGIEAERCRQGQQREASQNDEVAVGDVDEAHDAGAERKTGREKRIKSSQQDALHKLVDREPLPSRCQTPK